jgi:prephenate dehydratase
LQVLSDLETQLKETEKKLIGAAVNRLVFRTGVNHALSKDYEALVEKVNNLKKQIADKKGNTTRF